MPAAPARGAALLRWLLVVLLAVGIVSGPTVVASVGHRGAEAGGRVAVPVSPDVLRARVLASGSVPHQGLAEFRGTVGLPDLPRFGDVAALLGGTTRARVWWSAPSLWRVDRLTAGGEQGTYARGPGIGVEADTVVVWDYERNRRQTVVGNPAVRLPRTEDLLAPQLARRLLAGLTSGDRLSALPPKWVAGHPGTGLRIEPSDPRGTVGAVDVWADAATGLPLEVQVSTAAGVVAVTSRWLDLELTPPPASLLRPPRPPLARLESTTAPDAVARFTAQRRWVLPARLAGSAVAPSVAGAASYGRGLARFAVVPLPTGLAGDVLDGARGLAPPRTVPGGRLAVIRSGVLSAVAAVGDDGEHAYVLIGLVLPEVLELAATELLASPPPAAP